MACRKAGLAPGATRRPVARCAASARPARRCRPRASAGSTTRSAPTVQLPSVSGGTDVCTGVRRRVAALPVWAGEISCRHARRAVEAFDADGPAGRRRAGRAGDHRADAVDAGRLLGRPRRRRATARPTSTTSRACGATATGSRSPSAARASITGRSDATLNRGGVRLGTAEFYAVVEGLPEVADSLVVHLEDATADRAAAAVRRAAPTARRSTTRCARGSRGELRTALSPRHVPDEILAVPAIPRTLSGKKLEVPVKRILTGTPADEAALARLARRPDLARSVRGARRPQPDRDAQRRIADGLRRAAHLGAVVPRSGCDGPPTGTRPHRSARRRVGTSVPRKVAVTVRQGDDRVVARGEGLARKAKYLPMTRFAAGRRRDHARGSLADPGGPRRHRDPPRRRGRDPHPWWNAEDGSAWRWSVEFSNRRG